MTQHTSGDSRRSKLLQDLESLEDMLRESDDLIPTLERVIPGARQATTAIPTLDEPVDSSPVKQSPPESNPDTATPAAGEEDEDYTLEFLVQDVIDEFVPRIEAELRQRLLNMDPDMLRRWLNAQPRR